MYIQCRCCAEILAEDSGFFPLFENISAHLLEHIYLISGLKLKDDTSMPKTICKTCYGKLQTAIEFRFNTINAQIQLERIARTSQVPVSVVIKEEVDLDKENSGSKERSDCNNSFYENILSSVTVVEADLNKNTPRLNALEDDIDYDKNTLNNEEVPTQNDKNAPETIQDELTKMNSRLESLELHIANQTATLEQVIESMADILKVTPNMFPKEKSNFVMDPLPLVESGNIRRIESEEELIEFEKNLKDPSFNDNLKRIFRRVFDLNGKRDGSAFFKTVIRKLISPIVLSSYSWEGAKKKAGSSDESDIKQGSFKKTFPTFIDFVSLILQESDHHYTIEHSNRDFSLYLRQKNTEIKRFLDGGLQRRISSKRRQTITKQQRNETKKNRVKIQENDKYVNESQAEENGKIDDGDENPFAMKTIECKL